MGSLRLPKLTFILLILVQMEASFDAKVDAYAKEEFDNLFGGIEKLLIDATESPKQRPSNKEEQKNYYSGKKKSYAKGHVNYNKR